MPAGLGTDSRVAPAGPDLDRPATTRQRGRRPRSRSWTTASGWALCSGWSTSVCWGWASARCTLGTERWSPWWSSSSGCCSGSWASRLWGWWGLCASSSFISRSDGPPDSTRFTLLMVCDLLWLWASRQTVLLRGGPGCGAEEPFRFLRGRCGGRVGSGGVPDWNHAWIGFFCRLLQCELLCLSSCVEHVQKHIWVFSPQRLDPKSLDWFKCSFSFFNVWQ